jgi:L-lactate dehydrogenase complex protein LldF
MTTQPMQFIPGSEFKRRAAKVVANPFLRKSFRGAMDFLIAKRAAQFPDPELLERQRTLAEEIRRYSLSRLPALLEQLEANLVKNGVKVHWAENADEANAIILGICRQHDARLMVKGKSMVSEEVELNHAMDAAGIEALESDMGEYIVQLAGEKPSHIIMPAIHKTKQDIAKLFAEKVPGVAYTEDVDALIQVGRDVLRRKFLDADIGLSGVNFAVAETGSLCLVENEGNGRMCTTVPNVHIAITGIEKVVEKLEHVVPLYGLLTRSATGQAITTYFNVITGPRREGEKDGPREMHLVLVDNGRTQAYADEQLRQTLQCIRCGACMNHCPVYTRIGGHAYGTTYPGPIGEIISPHMMGLEATHVLPGASTLCGACGEVCPVKIPIPDLLLRLREEATHDARPGRAPLVGQGAGKTTFASLAYKGFAFLYSRPALYRLFAWAATRLPLRDDIRLLGRLLGDTVRDQEGEAAFELVETIRQNSVRFRRDDDIAARRELEAMLDACRASRPSRWCAPSATSRTWPTSPRTSTTSAARRAHLIAGSAPARRQPGARAAARARLPASMRRWPPSSTRAQVSPVLTAHPTEVQRKSILNCHRDRPPARRARPHAAHPRGTAEANDEALRRAVLTLWQTRMLRTAKLSVIDEVNNGLSYFDYTFLRELPRLYASLEDRLAAPTRRWGAPELPPSCRWAAGSAATATATPSSPPRCSSAALAMQSKGALGASTSDELHTLGSSCRSPSAWCRPPTRCCALAAASPDRSPHRSDEPYRRAHLRHLRALAATYRALARPRSRRATRWPRPQPTPTPPRWPKTSTPCTARWSPTARRARARPPAPPAPRGEGVRLPPGAARPAPELGRA